MRSYHAFWIPTLVLFYLILWWALTAQADYTRFLESEVARLQPTPAPINPLCGMGYGIPCPPTDTHNPSIR